MGGDSIRYRRGLLGTGSHTPPMTHPRSDRSTDRVSLSDDIDQERLETFVHRATAGAYEADDPEALRAAVTAIERLLDQPTATDEAATVPAATKWAAAAGYQDEQEAGE